MNTDSTIQHRPVQRPLADFGFENGELVPVTNAPEIADELDAAPANHQLAYELLGEALRGIVTAGHADAMPTRVAALLVLMGIESEESAAKIAKVHRTTIARVVALLTAEMKVYAERKGLEIKGT